MKKIVLLTLPFLILCLLVQAQDLTPKMDSLIAAYRVNNQFNGSVLVAQKGRILYQKGFGYRNAETKVPNDAGSVYQIGSLTKQFTAAIIMQLQQEKKLSVSDKLSKYFSGFVNGDKITIEQLLTHTSGLFNYTNDSTILGGDVTRHYSRDEMIALFKKYPSDFEPGTKWNYSNSGYSMLGYIIEKVTGKPYEKVVRERIFQPLGMTQTGFDFSNYKSPSKTQGYFSLGESVNPAPIVDSTIAYSAGAIYSSVGDLYKWERSIAANKILNAESWKTIFTPRMNKYGFGWVIDTLYGRSFTAHSGGIHGYTSYLIRFPEDELVVIMMDNASSRSLSPMSRALAAIALGKPYVIPAKKEGLLLALGILINYVGEYELAPGFTITVTLDAFQLKAQATGQPQFDLYAEKENLFYLKVAEAKVEFVRDDKGVATELILYQGGREMHGKKIR